MSQALVSDQARLSILCVMGASLAFSLNDITVKYFTDSLPLHEVILFRSLFGMAFILFLFGRGVSLKTMFSTRRLSRHILRGLSVVVANFAFFAGLAALPLAEASAIFFIAPLLITGFSAFFLGEYVGVWRWTALLVGLLGVLIIVKPGSAAFQWAVILPLLSAIAYATLHTITRSMGLAESPITMSLYIQLVFIVVCLGMGLMFGDGRFAGLGHPSAEFILRAWAWPSGRDVLLFVAAGFFSASGGYLISQAYRSSSAGLVAPFEYSTIILAVLWGYIFWKEVPGLSSAFGIFLIIASGVFVAIREFKRQVPPASQKLSARR
ncbi:DMT family transporter [Rhodobacteraceae bacterium]|nr:DMT family transporter [Paracoccaceae bacterium]MDA9855707.1 DMT family transporter [Paracoccaceae bacterium]